VVFHESISAAVTRYYVFNGLFKEGEDSMTFEEVDANLIEVGDTLQKDHAGSARAFFLELESFDEETHHCELIVGFTIWPYEDNDSEIELIRKTVSEHLENVGFIEDDAYYLGDGPDRR
jgi:hypothetical protein